MRPKANHHKSQNKKQSGSSDNKVAKIDDKRASAEKEEEEVENPNSGFSEYLKSGTGLEMMRMFVVANSLVLFVTVAWPSMKQSYEIVKEFFYGEETEI